MAEPMTDKQAEAAAQVDFLPNYNWHGNPTKFQTC